MSKKNAANITPVMQKYLDLKKEYDDATLETAGGNKGQIFALGAQITF